MQLSPLNAFKYHWVTEYFQECKWPNMIGPENVRIVASGAVAPHGRGSRGPLKGPAGSRGRAPGGGPGGQRPRKLTHFEHFKAILDTFPGSTGALQASTQRGNCFMFTLTCFIINWEIQSITGCKVNNFFMNFLNDNYTWIKSYLCLPILTCDDFSPCALWCLSFLTCIWCKSLSLQFSISECNPIRNVPYHPAFLASPISICLCM